MRSLRGFIALALISFTLKHACAAESAPIIFYADLSADEQTAPTESPGKGRADFTLDRDTLKFSWKITYSGLTSEVTGVRIHGPQRVGVNSNPLYDAGLKGLKSPVVGSVIMGESELQYLMERHIYVNITTKKYPDGELRGHVERTRPKALQD